MDVIKDLCQFDYSPREECTECPHGEPCVMWNHWVCAACGNLFPDTYDRDPDDPRCWSCKRPGQFNDTLEQMLNLW